MLKKFRGAYRPAEAGYGVGVMFKTEYGVVFDPEGIAMLSIAIQRARERRPNADAQKIARRVVALASMGVTDLDELIRAGVGDD